MLSARSHSAALLAATTALAAGLVGCGGDKAVTSKRTTPAVSAEASKAAAVPAATGLLTSGAVKGGLPSVVSVSVSGGGSTRTGTGTLIASGGVVTDASLVTTASGRPAAGVTVREGNGDEHAGVVDGIDKLTGLAVIGVQDLTAVPIAKWSSAPVELGQDVVSLGFLSARRPAMRPGTVVTTGRSVRLNGTTEVGLFEATAPLGSQGFGGPVVDETGRVVGITTKALPSIIPGAVVALPIGTVRRIASALIKDGTVRRAYLGLTTVGVTPARAAQLHLATSAGVLISSIVAGSPAQFVGLVKPTSSTLIGGRPIPTGGDIVVGFNKLKIDQPEDLDAAVNASKPGQRVSLHVIRGQSAVVVHVTLGEH